MSADRSCEHYMWQSGLPCGSRAPWAITVGSRRLDPQFSCSRHLARSCETVLGAENRDGATLTVARASAFAAPPARAEMSEVLEPAAGEETQAAREHLDECIKTLSALGDGIDDEYCGNCAWDSPGCGCPRDPYYDGTDPRSLPVQRREDAPLPYPAQASAP